MDRTFADVVMNPVRQRIAQYLILNKTGTVGDIAAALSDVPRASLYRHIKVLQDAGCIRVVEEHAVRGTVRKVYALVQQPLGDVTQAQVAQLVQDALSSAMLAFSTYFKREDADPQRDLLSVSSSTLMLTDAELMALLGKIGEAYGDYINNQPAEGRKPRMLLFVSAPVNGETEGV